MPSTQETLGLIQQPAGEAGRSEVQGYSVYRELETSLDSMRLCLNLTSHKKKKKKRTSVPHWSGDLREDIAVLQGIDTKHGS